ncbi:MAG: isopenicillin N synthase family oxygenase [Bacteroidetes bacterium]|nr:MAG: isopenicillin N synthase family oxygenase [Bacteroidota bacterium]TAG94597.1 MAG: isopenicillin N synthase family oxygenase [Bacteroidota bacterium]
MEQTEIVTQMLFEEIPSLDLADFTQGDADKKQNFVTGIGNAFNQIGFVAIKNHGLSDDLATKLYDIFQKFFALPDEIKQKYDVSTGAGQRGYTGKGKEHAKGRSTGDLKEFYHIGQEVIDGDKIKSEYPDNVFPSELPMLRDIGLEIYQTLENAGKNILRAIALYLNLEENYFDSRVHNGNSILRAIHYYPILDTSNIADDAVRAAAHGDINLITLLMGASAEGLQILRKDNKWIPVTALPDQIIVNVGDMLERLTNNRLKSTIHRVVNPPKEKMNLPRYSMPFFMHPRSEMDLTCLSSCVSAENPKQYADTTAGDFLDERLREIGLKK